MQGVKMENQSNEDKYSMVELKRAPYRTLQKYAKEMKLPANLKKQALIDLVHTKIHGTEDQIGNLVQVLRRPRRKVAKKRSKRLQRIPTNESTRTASSSSRDYQTMYEAYIQHPTERVIRTRSYGKRAYNVVNLNNHVIGLIKETESPKTETNDEIFIIKRPILMKNTVQNSERDMQVYTHQNRMPLVPKNNRRVSILGADNIPPRQREKEQEKRCVTISKGNIRISTENRVVQSERKIVRGVLKTVPLRRLTYDSRPLPQKRVIRTLSGIYPLGDAPKPAQFRYKIVPGGVTVTHHDGSISKIDKYVKIPVNTDSEAAKNPVSESIGENAKENLPCYSLRNSKMRFEEITNDCTNLRMSINTNMQENNGLNDSDRAFDELLKDDRRNDRQSLKDINISPDISPEEDYSIENSTDMSTNVTKSRRSNAKSIHTQTDPEITKLPPKQSPEQATNAYTNTSINGLNYFNVPSVYTDIIQFTSNTYVPDESNENRNVDVEFADYCHKKIRAEKIRTRKYFNRELPRIHEVFSRFQNRDVTQPIYVQAGEDVDRFCGNRQYPTSPPAGQQASLTLEVLYNVPTAHYPITSSRNCQTHTAQATPMMAATMVQSTASYMQYDIPSYTEDNVYPNGCDYEREGDAATVPDEEVNSPTPGSTISLGATVTIPDLVEDALELISLDGWVPASRCPLCAWRGARLQRHMTQDHGDKIHYLTSPTWTIEMSLRAFVCSWNKVCVAPDGGMYALMTKAGRTRLRLACVSVCDCVEAGSGDESPPAGAAAGSATGSTGGSTAGSTPGSRSIVLMLLGAGEPRGWRGEIRDLTVGGYFNDGCCLSVPLAALGLDRRDPTSATYDAVFTVHLHIV